MADTSKLTQTIYKIVSSKYFFKAVLFIFIFESLWIALSSNYPMAFDEDFHSGIIRLYASHISPFWVSQPHGADVYGAVARDPSYLYQYLMSFPYRLITLFTNKQSEIVIFLRLINIALGAWGVYLFKRLLVKTKISQNKINFSLLVYVLLPVVPLLAAQINYDNLFFPLTALALIMTINLTDKVFKKKVDTALLIKLVIVCLLTCLVKYAFVPIAVIIALYLAYEIRKNIGLGSFWDKLKISWLKIKRLQKYLLVFGLLVSLVLFSQRYAVNVVRYHSLVPDCSKVLTINQCKQYGPWIRDYNFKINKVDTEIGTEKNVLTFSADWFYGMWLRTFFTVTGPNQLYQSRSPLPIPSLSAVVFALVGLAATVISFKKLLRRYNAHHILFLTLAAAFYTASLWFDEFGAYLDTGQPVAINGRYIFPVLLPAIVFLVAGLSMFLKKHINLQAYLAAICILCLLWGGGLLTFILRSSDNWYFNSSFVRNINHDVQHIFWPIVPGTKNSAQFLT